MKQLLFALLQNYTFFIVNVSITSYFEQRRTGGLVIWRSGSVMVVYRGSNYKRPSKSELSDVQSNPTQVPHEAESLFIPDVSDTSKLDEDVKNVTSLKAEQTKPSEMSCGRDENMTEEERECNSLLDGLGPRFIDWWGTGILPVDADLLPQNIPGFKTPFRLLPVGMRSRLSNAELTNLRKLARTLPCHFALGMLQPIIMSVFKSCFFVASSMVILSLLTFFLA